MCPSVADAELLEGLDVSVSGQTASLEGIYVSHSGQFSKVREARCVSQWSI